jgi:hypothetical protein
MAATKTARPPAAPPTGGYVAGDFDPRDTSALAAGLGRMIGGSLYIVAGIRCAMTGAPWKTIVEAKPYQPDEAEHLYAPDGDHGSMNWPGKYAREPIRRLHDTSDVYRLKTFIRTDEAGGFPVTRGVTIEAVSAFMARYKAMKPLPAMADYRLAALAEVVQNARGPRLLRHDFQASPAANLIEPLLDEILADCDELAGSAFRLGGVKVGAGLVNSPWTPPSLLWKLFDRHVSGDFGLVGSLVAADPTDDERWYAPLATPLNRNRIAIDERRGIVQSEFPIARPAGVSGPESIHIATALDGDGPPATYCSFSRPPV